MSYRLIGTAILAFSLWAAPPGARADDGLAQAPEASEAEAPAGEEGREPAALKTPATPAATPREHALARLKAAGISAELTAVLEKTHLPEERDAIVARNVLGFLRKADYSGHYSKRALRKCQEFMRKHRRSLQAAQRRTGVPQEVITALLWVETKLGTRTGSVPVGHAFFSLLQADHPEVIKATLAELALRSPAAATPQPTPGLLPDSTEANRQKAVARSGTKAAWALEELKALDEMYRRDPARVSKLAGSYAGAFGFPQFIPSSYLKWSRSAGGKRPADLYRFDDAIHSVAFYLKSNGWKKAQASTHRDALFHYNRAEGYVQVILKIARGTTPQGPLPAPTAAAAATGRQGA